MSNQTIFTANSVEDNTNSLAALLPNGPLFDAKYIPDSELRKLLYSLAFEITRNEQIIADIAYDYNILVTTELLPYWERTLGIPDCCFPGDGTIEERRRDVLVKFTHLHCATKEALVRLAALYGYTVRINGGSRFGTFPLEFPVRFFPNSRAARFTLIVEFFTNQPNDVFPLPFPLQFGTKITNIIECLFRRICPAYLKLIFIYNPPST